MGEWYSQINRSKSLQKVARKKSGVEKAPDAGILQLSRLLRKNGAQAKLTIGKPNDRYEQEADRMADRVMASTDSSAIATPLAGGITPLSMQRAEEEEMQATPLLQRQEEEEEAAQPKMLQRQPEEEEEEEAQAKLRRQEEEEEMAQTKRDGTTVAPAPMSVQMSSIRSGGRPLPASEREFFEPRFGIDFSGVRVHEGGQANQMAHSVQAKAFTVGQDVVFGAGQYAPGSTRGRKLLAHELTHVVQQGGGIGGKLQPFRDISRSAPSSTFQRQCLGKKV